ncbi:hypothetical protein [Cupriavidus sp. USMAHM13]|uniref:hypothetical protein n=1 Tax=Cupriavidus sp. USMAHM13 TaxID=1389192 RepID=UPI0012E9CD9C|nr:hypothetical protein [Cupriavidus sp. USMAHM13]
MHLLKNQLAGTGVPALTEAEARTAGRIAPPRIDLDQAQTHGIRAGASPGSTDAAESTVAAQRNLFVRYTS